MDTLTTIGLVIGGILAAAGAITTLGGAVEKIVKVVKVAKAPNDLQNDRLKVLEERMDSVEQKLIKDKAHLDKIDEGNRVTQLALLALLDHGIDGNNIAQMEDAKVTLQKHLINK